MWAQEPRNEAMHVRTRKTSYFKESLYILEKDSMINAVFLATVIR